MSQLELIREVGSSMPDDIFNHKELTLCFDMFEKGFNYSVQKTFKWLQEQKEMVGISFEKDFYERYINFMNGKET